MQPRDNGLAQVTIFGKGDKTRHVLISKRLHRELTRVSGDGGNDAPVFPSKTGKPLDQPAVFRVMQAAAQRAGIEQAVSPHWFRHAAASHALDNGCPIGLVKEQLGHSQSWKPPASTSMPGPRMACSSICDRRGHCF